MEFYSNLMMSQTDALEAPPPPLPPPPTNYNYLETILEENSDDLRSDCSENSMAWSSISHRLMSGLVTDDKKCVEEETGGSDSDVSERDKEIPKKKRKIANRAFPFDFSKVPSLDKLDFNFDSKGQEDSNAYYYLCRGLRSTKFGVNLPYNTLSTEPNINLLSSGPESLSVTFNVDHEVPLSEGETDSNDTIHSMYDNVDDYTREGVSLQVNDQQCKPDSKTFLSEIMIPVNDPLDNPNKDENTHVNGVTGEGETRDLSCNHVVIGNQIVSRSEPNSFGETESSYEEANGASPILNATYIVGDDQIKSSSNDEEHFSSCQSDCSNAGVPPFVPRLCFAELSGSEVENGEKVSSNEVIDNAGMDSEKRNHKTTPKNARESASCEKSNPEGQRTVTNDGNIDQNDPGEFEVRPGVTCSLCRKPSQQNCSLEMARSSETLSEDSGYGDINQKYEEVTERLAKLLTRDEQRRIKIYTDAELSNITDKLPSILRANYEEENKKAEALQLPNLITASCGDQVDCETNTSMGEIPAIISDSSRRRPLSVQLAEEFLREEGLINNDPDFNPMHDKWLPSCSGEQINHGTDRSPSPRQELPLVTIEEEGRCTTFTRQPSPSELGYRITATATSHNPGVLMSDQECPSVSVKINTNTPLVAVACATARAATLATGQVVAAKGSGYKGESVADEKLVINTSCVIESVNTTDPDAGAPVGSKDRSLSVPDTTIHSGGELGGAMSQDYTPRVQVKRYAPENQVEVYISRRKQNTTSTPNGTLEQPKSPSVKGVHFSPIVSEVNWRESYIEVDDSEGEANSPPVPVEVAKVKICESALPERVILTESLSDSKSSSTPDSNVSFSNLESESGSLSLSDFSDMSDARYDTSDCEFTLHPPDRVKRKKKLQAPRISSERVNGFTGKDKHFQQLDGDPGQDFQRQVIKDVTPPSTPSSIGESIKSSVSSPSPTRPPREKHSICPPAVENTAPKVVAAKQKGSYSDDSGKSSSDNESNFKRTDNKNRSSFWRRLGFGKSKEKLDSPPSVRPAPKPFRQTDFTTNKPETIEISSPVVKPQVEAIEPPPESPPPSSPVQVKPPTVPRAKPPLPPQAHNQPRHLSAQARARLTSARRHFFNSGNTGDSPPVAPPRSHVTKSSEHLKEAIQQFCQRAQEDRETLARSVPDLKAIEAAVRSSVRKRIDSPAVASEQQPCPGDSTKSSTNNGASVPRWLSFRRQLGRSKSVSGVLETDIDTLDSRELLLLHETNLDEYLRQLIPENLEDTGLKAKSMMDLGLSPGPVMKSSCSAGPDSRAKSMEFLLDEGNKASVQPPENELMKEERKMSEHELRIQRSLQKLNLPDWYKDAASRRKFSADGFILGRRREWGSGSTLGGTSGWSASKTTSWSSLQSSRSTTPTRIVIPSRVRAPDWKYIKSSKESLVSPQSTTSSTPSPGELSERVASPSFSSFAHVRSQPYLGWRSQEKLTGSNSSLSTYLSPAERLAMGMQQQQQQQQQQQLQNNPPVKQESPKVPQTDLSSSIKEVTNAIVHYCSENINSVLSQPKVNSMERRSDKPFTSTATLSPSLSPNKPKRVWVESSFVGSRPIQSPETPKEIDINCEDKLFNGFTEEDLRKLSLSTHEKIERDTFGDLGLRITNGEYLIA